MHTLDLVPFLVIVTLYAGFVTAATLPSTTEETVGIDLLNHYHRRCTAHSDCSCSGIAVCHTGYCRCIFTLTNTEKLDKDVNSLPSINTQIRQLGLERRGGHHIHHGEHHHKRCSAHSDCSCMEGIAICHEGYCSCIFTQYICTRHHECSSLCHNRIGICIYNACKCYSLVEDVRLSESISPMIDEVPPN